MVTSNPVHPARAIGCKSTSRVASGSQAPLLTSFNTPYKSELPSIQPPGDSATSGDSDSPYRITGMVTARPARGPAAPMSISLRRSRVTWRIPITAPMVPKPSNGGSGMKWGNEACTR